VPPFLGLVRSWTHTILNAYIKSGYPIYMGNVVHRQLSRIGLVYIWTQNFFECIFKASHKLCVVCHHFLVWYEVERIQFWTHILKRLSHIYGQRRASPIIQNWFGVYLNAQHIWMHIKSGVHIFIYVYIVCHQFLVWYEVERKQILNFFWTHFKAAACICICVCRVPPFLGLVQSWTHTILNAYVSCSVMHKLVRPLYGPIRME